MTLVSRSLYVILFLMIAGGVFAQQPQSVQTASLRLSRQLRWQRISPSAQHTDGPVLYQLVFTPGTPGAIAGFGTDPRHLVSSDITDNGGIVAIGASGFTINAGTGIVNFMNGQTFPKTVTYVAPDQGLLGGLIQGNVTLSLDTRFTNQLYSRLAAANTFTTGTQVIQTGAANKVGLAVEGASAQTANLQEWWSYNFGLRPVSSVSASGVFNGDGSGLTNLSNSQLVGDNSDLLQHKAALLQWYRQDFAAGSGPVGVAFDGDNVWITNINDNTVTKLRATDGASLGTFPVDPVTHSKGPAAAAFDGANIWIVNSGSDTLTKLRASDGGWLENFYLGGSSTSGVAFDGANIWVADNIAGVEGFVTKLRASDGMPLGTFPAATDARGLAFDGANIWVADAFTDATGHATISKLRASDGAGLGTFLVGSNPLGVAFDGANIWVANTGSNNVTKLRAADGANLGTFPVGSVPAAIAFDGANIWVSNTGSNNVTKLRATDGANLGTFPVGTNPKVLAFDGASIWVANFGSNNVTRF